MRNIPTVHPIFVDQLNTYDVITSQYVVFTKEAFEAFVAAKTEPKEADLDGRYSQARSRRDS